jgi:3-phenylpropionate/trans-cinnamate dioxygenase ferredoxin component
MDSSFVKICSDYELIENEGKLFELNDETEIALFKVKNKIYAVDNICPHNHSPVIFRGSIENNYISCPVHGFKFNLKTGKQPGRAGCTLRTFEVKTENNAVFVKKPERKTFDFDF